MRSLRAYKAIEKPYGLLQPLTIPEERWRRINIEFITKLPATGRGNDTIITIIDALTKRAHWIPTREAELTATKFAEIFRDAYFRLHGLPDVVVSDRDVRFTSEFWRTLVAEFDTKLAMSTAFHPQTDGQAEKANSIVERYLRAYTASRQGEWDQLLALAEFAYNASRHQSLERSPFEADLGYIPRMPLDAVAAAVGVAPRRSPRGSDERGDGVPDNHGDARGILEKARNYSSDRVARVFWQC
jgi:transposase InsO family protein